jgi:hypothetical protein
LFLLILSQKLFFKKIKGKQTLKVDGAASTGSQRKYGGFVWRPVVTALGISTLFICYAC